MNRHNFIFIVRYLNGRMILIPIRARPRIVVALPLVWPSCSAYVLRRLPLNYTFGDLFSIVTSNSDLVYSVYVRFIL